MSAATPPVLALPGAGTDLMGRVGAGLEEVRALLARRVDHEDPFIAEASGHLLEAGGKLFRPTLTLLASELGSGRNADVIAAAASVELVHLASLYHDDVMDDSTLRRGAPTANAKYDNSTAILVGDLLFGTASDIVADLGPEAVKIQAQTFVRLCSGQIRDDRPAPGGADPVDYYLRVLADKTGVLVATAARYGAMFGGAGPEVVEAVRSYGECLGMAFQLADDLLDIASESDQSGKTPGTDLREGKATLPVLHVREARRAEDARLLELASGPISSEDDLAEALSLLRPHPAMEQARARTREIGAEAAAALTVVPDSEAKAALVALVEGVIDRVG